VSMAIGNKLTVIKSHAVIKKKLYIICNWRFIVLSDGLLQLIINFIQSIHHHLSFFLR